jgi:cellulose synthase operon protein C
LVNFCSEENPMSEPRQRPLLRVVAAALALAFGVAAGGCTNGADVESLMNDAAQYRRKGEPGAAVIQLKNVLQKSPDHRPARLMLGAMYIEQGDAIAAENHLRRALALGAPAAQVNPLLGKALLMQGQYERILGEIEPAADAGGRAEILALRGNAMLGLQKPGPAAELFNEALQSSPSSAAALLGLARIALAQRRQDDAAALIARAISANPENTDCLRFQGDLLRMQGKPEAALASYRRILTLRPDDMPAHIDVANIHTDGGDFKQARAEIAAARKVAPASLGVLYAQAMLDFREGKQAAALEALQQIVRAAPDHFPSILLLAAVQSAVGADQLAEEQLRKFLAAYPRHVYASRLMGALYLRTNRQDAAMALLDPLLDSLAAVREDDVELLTLAGEAHLRARQFGRAAGYFEKAIAMQPNESKLHTALALSRLGNGDNGRAVAELERAASLDTKSPRAATLLVMTYLRAGTPDKAFATVRQMELKANTALVQNLKGVIFLAGQHIKNARASFEHALALDPLFMPALDNLANLDTLAKRPADTEKRYRDALAKAPGNIALMEALARLAMAQGKTGEAIAWLERARRQNPEQLAPALRLAELYARAGEKQKALVLAQQLQAANPSNADAVALLAHVYYLNVNFGAAADSYAMLAALMPGSAAPYMKLATMQLAARNEAAAIGALRKALEIEPRLLEAHLALQKLLIGQKKYSEAMALAAALQQRVPDSPAGLKLEGDVHSARNQPGLALGAYERAFAMENNGPLLIQVHAALVKTGKAAEADARMSRWLKDHPADVATRMYFASSKVIGNDNKGAIEQLQAVLKHDPNNVVALNDLAWTLHRINDRNALAYAERAYQLAPGNPSVMDTLGWIALAGGNVARALTLLQKASALSPNASEIRFHFGMVLARSGDKRGARREIERALASPAEFSKRAEAKAFLSTL